MYQPWWILLSGLIKCYSSLIKWAVVFPPFYSHREFMCKTGIVCSFSVCLNLPVKPSGPGVFFVGSCLLLQGLKSFYYEIIIDSQKVAKKCTERSCIPFTQFSPMVTSYITLVQYRKQKIGLVTAHMPYSDFTSFMCIHLWVYVCTISCNFMTCVNWCNHHYNQDIELFHHRKDPFYSSL